MATLPTPVNPGATPLPKSPKGAAQDYFKGKSDARIAKNKRVDSYYKTADAKRQARHKLETSHVSRVVSAEFGIAITLAVLALFFGHEDKAGTKFVMRMTGLSGIFFILALSSNSEKIGRYVMGFGLLIDVALALHLVVSGDNSSTTSPSDAPLPTKKTGVEST